MPATSEAAAQELVVTRIFDAPRELLWRARTDPEHFKRWLGPQGYTAPNREVRPAHRWTLRVVHAFAGGSGPYSTGVFEEIVEHERLVYTDSFADSDGNPVSASHYGMDGDLPIERTVTVTFEDQGGKTKMTLRHAAAPSAEFSEMEQAGWNESFDKLLASLRS